MNVKDRNCANAQKLTFWKTKMPACHFKLAFFYALSLFVIQ